MRANACALPTPSGTFTPTGLISSLTETITFTGLQNCPHIPNTARREVVVIAVLAIGCSREHDVITTTPTRRTFIGIGVMLGRGGGKQREGNRRGRERERKREGDEGGRERERERREGKRWGGRERGRERGMKEGERGRERGGRERDGEGERGRGRRRGRG